MPSQMHTHHHILRPLTRILIAIVLLSPIGVALARLGYSRAERPPGAGPATSAPTTPTTRPDIDDVRRRAPKPLLGFAINAHHISDLPLYLESVDGIADLGANTLIVVTPMYQKKADSTRVRTLRARCPTPDQLRAILGRGKEHGLYTILMPILLIERPGEKDWRGVIRPSDWDDWWRSYEKSLGQFVDLAASAGVDMLSIGSELNTTEEQLDRWEPLIARVRAQFPGLITYSSNWDRYHLCKLWPLVDVMSVSSYFELERNRPGAPEADLTRAWGPIREDLLAAARRWDRPLILSELGYPSLPWANAHPWNYVAEDDTPTDHEAQARSWRAFFAAWSDVIAEPESEVLGFCGYRWDPYHRGDDQDTGYGILGKPAHAVVRNGIAGLRRRPTEATAPTTRPAKTRASTTKPEPVTTRPD